ncbi:RAVE (Rav1p, Rav2p, Skp1p) complex subunit [Komagataella phaffii CBS 7435]|uniref:RAVE (Rav1p, Rav2p, Skp1p) complex subunit n=1 Tax=Komagataella phaffii (strain ATCC 76273 / CBS 7435 / CECT 11047 / NRRL Y-11430 / Wegner 21-1) TaxID=981350 RepID=F2QTA8_KOMPC|nr:GQ67_00383T0 [Komagataella phaffii]AOA67114.1 GQ68_01006T0 [Komagataella phaffii GS115]CAH2448520.1 RAVE (Rav1p, Rav2p, Skp1p) complex subunit [Komagataella phaffii CBS 7435]CCA38636.1 RAVE (Rav1p, Rav2p, Skp1p) complex subunit [Komagataella phaffii CBS 7435]
MNFLPGEPNRSIEAVRSCNWNDVPIISYCSGNNLIILTNNCARVQTIYLDKDPYSVDINKLNGKIAITLDNELHIYKPVISNYFQYKRSKNLADLRIEYQHELTVTNDEDSSRINSICWSDHIDPTDDEDSSNRFLDLPDDLNTETSCEIVVGSMESLTLWRLYYKNKRDHAHMTISARKLWFKVQPSPIYLCKVSPSSDLIVSCGIYDSFIKVWFRVSYGIVKSEFDLTYLNNQVHVSQLRWKQEVTEASSNRDHMHTLYSIGVDSKMRVWSIFEIDGIHSFYYSGSVDFKAEDEPSFILNIDGSITKRMIADLKRKKKQVSELLLEEDLELCMVIYSSGKAELYSMEHLNSLPARPLSIEKLPIINGGILKFGENCLPKPFLLIYFQELTISSDNNLKLVLHDLNKSTIRDVSLGNDFLLDVARSTDQPTSHTEKETLVPVGKLDHKFTGHMKSIRRLIRSIDGSSVLSITRFNESYLWYPIRLSNGVTLSKKCTIRANIVVAVILAKSDIVIGISAGEISVWSTALVPTKTATKLTSLPIDEDLTPVSFFLLPEFNRGNKNLFHIIAIYDVNNVKCWKFDLSSKELSKITIANIPFSSPNNSEIHLIQQIDPVGHSNRFTRTPKDILSIVDKDGYVNIFGIKFEEGRYHWIRKFFFHSNTPNMTYIKGSSLHKVAIVNSSKKVLSIWDCKRKFLEYQETFSEDLEIKDIDWTCTDYSQSILAIGFNKHVLLFTQLRYDYTNETPSYKPIKNIDLSSMTTHDIGDSVWLEDGTIAIGCSNQFYVCDKSLDMNDAVTQDLIGSYNDAHVEDIFELCAFVNGPLPLYHPQFVIQSFFLGKYTFVEKLLVQMYNKLRELDLNPELDASIELSRNFGSEKISDYVRDQENFSTDNTPQVSRTPSAVFDQNDLGEATRLKPDVSKVLLSKLVKYRLPFLTGHQQITLASTIEILTDILEKYQDVLDPNGLRFFLGYKLFLLNSTKVNQVYDSITMRDVNFALHSDNKDVLLNMILDQQTNSKNKLTWKLAERFKLSYWIPNSKLQELFESIARNEFLQYSIDNDGKRDPSTCSIFYLALRKKQILIGLWKNSIGHPEQSKMLRFLSQNFKEQRWKSAALKNAFVLMSKHRYLDAAIFFLLGDSLKDCVNVLVKKLEDVPLAIAVARVYEGNDHGPVLKELLTNTILVSSAVKGDRWTTSWVFWKLSDRNRSIQALIKNCSELIEDDQILSEISKSQRSVTIKDTIIERVMDDPVMMIVYDGLRKKHIDYFKGLTNINPRLEFEFILRVVAIYERMGCDLISLYIVKNFNFMKRTEIITHIIEKDQKVIKNGNTTHVDNGHAQLEQATKNGNVEVSPKIEENNSAISSTSSDHTRRKSVGFSKKLQPPPTEFQEPDMSSFNFGF